jgi:RNA polymerase sigma-70 factor (ECF subfamily)
VRLVRSEDAVLVARLAAGDDDAIGEVFDRFAPVVYAVARGVLADPAAAEDVTQDVFVALWRHPERYDATLGGLRTYLSVLARRRAVDVVRSELRRVAREERHGRLVPDQAIGRSDETDVVVTAGVVRDAVRSLPPEQRRVVELAYFHGLSYRDVAAAVGIPEGTAKSRLRLALAKLESALDRELLETS